MFILQLVYYGDLLIPTPAWVSFAPQAQIIGRHIDFLPTKAKDGWRLTGDQPMSHTVHYANPKNGRGFYQL